MCSRLNVKLFTGGTAVVRPGDTIAYRPAGESRLQEADWGYANGKNGDGSIRYQGFARWETLKTTWLDRGWQTGTIPATDFTEGHGEGRIWAGRDGQVACVHRNGIVLVVTRQATQHEWVMLNHHRVPVQIVGDKAVLPSRGGADWFGQ